MWALQSGAAGRVSALVYTMPFWAMMLGWVFLGETGHGSSLACRRLLSAPGWYSVLDPAHLGRQPGRASCSPSPRACRWAASAVVVKRIRARGPHRRDQSDGLADALREHPHHRHRAARRPRGPSSGPGAFIAALAYNVIPATAIAWVLWLYVLQVLPAGVAGISTLATPVIGIVSAALVLGERVTPMEGAGMACIIAALLVLAIQGLSRRRRAQPTAINAGEAGPEGGSVEPVTEITEAAAEVVGGASGAPPPVSG